MEICLENHYSSIENLAEIAAIYTLSESENEMTEVENMSNLSNTES